MRGVISVLTDEDEHDLPPVCSSVLFHVYLIVFVLTIKISAPLVVTLRFFSPC